MSERAQALESWREQLDRLRLMADAGSDWDLSDNDRAAIRAALEQLAAPAGGVSPQPDDSTPDMGHGWFVTVGRWGDSIVTIEEKCLSGKPDFTAEDQALVRGAARHLLAFIGQPASVSPVEPTPPREMPTPWARRQPGEWIPTAECECERCAGAREREAGRDDDAPTQSMRIDPTPFVDTPVKQAKRRAFDNPTVANLDALIDVALASGAAPP